MKTATCSCGKEAALHREACAPARCGKDFLGEKITDNVFAFKELTEGQRRHLEEQMQANPALQAAVERVATTKETPDQ